jgi:hypothetical protein
VDRRICDTYTFLPEIGRKDDELGGRRRDDKVFVDVMKE